VDHSEEEEGHREKNESRKQETKRNTKINPAVMKKRIKSGSREMQIIEKHMSFNESC
jgi:hypothetical protein